MMTGDKDVEKLRRTIAAFIKKTPTKVGNTSVKFYKDRFVRGGWIGDGGLEKWKPRKRRDRNERRRGNRALLVKSGRLKRSIRVIKKTRDSVTVGTDVEYARMHNEGFEGRVSQSVSSHKRKSHMRRNGRSRRRSRVKEAKIKESKRTIKQKIPRRKFIGNSKFLNKRIEKKLEHDLKKELKRNGLI